MEIDPMSAASPDMTCAEMQALADSIRRIGQQVPILVWRGKVIDGRKRLAACESVGIAPVIHQVPDDGDPAQFATALNLLRTHYTPSQRAAFAEKIANATKGDGPRRSTNSEIITVAEAARKFGSGVGPVSLARRIRRTAAPEVMQAVERGNLSLHAASAIAAKVPHAEQAEVVEKVVAATTGKRNTPAKIINAAAPGLKRGPRRDTTVVRERALRTMYECACGLDQFMDAPLPVDVRQWHEWATFTITTLRTFTRKLGHERSA